MNTDEFIARLARDVKPVMPLQRPWVRAAIWLAGATAYVGALTWIMASSADESANGASWRFLLPQITAIATTVTAALAAFASVVPGRSPRVLLWPAGAAVVWLGGLLLGSLLEWNQGGVSVSSQREWLCVAMIAFGGALAALAMVFMLRDGAPLVPRATTALAALAGSGLANVGACFSQLHPSSVLMLIWHGSAILGLVALASWAGRSVLSWERLRRLHPL